MQADLCLMEVYTALWYRLTVTVTSLMLHHTKKVAKPHPCAHRAYKHVAVARKVSCGLWS